ncbi:Di-sulfide bridge nucleocytoplasmic transport domain-domain-containing protein [Absidia repens]|uniref:Di-sulfide bridge nucleocytoplasmic transport domain-domain-containing protein n=1 Tax=Absidia repens TaxID=90262 RepID=A0A1X2IZB1_9FUNG|nr:Di-sulfide bridge nucleocytoplasmic transport domain-domain-containing protein [Absidia repens]
MAYYQRTSEGPMEFEYEHAPILSFNSFISNKNDSPPSLDSPRNEPATPQASTPETSDLFLPKNYFNTNVHTTLDQNMSAQLGGISLKEGVDTTKASLDGKEHDRKNVDNDQTPDTTAVVPYHRPGNLPSTPSLSASLEHEPNHNNDTNSSSSNNTKSASMLFNDEQHDNSSPANTIEQQHQAYYSHLYPTASFYHHDPVAHRKSLVNYIAGLLRIGCQLVLFSIGLYIGFRFIHALNEDVAAKIELYESEYMEKYFLCEQEYHRNQCQNNNRPAMVEPCREWLRCLYTPAWIGKTKVLAETFAEIANGFVDTISLKAMGFGLLIIITTLWFSNQGKHTARQHQQGYHQPPPPPLPASYFAQHMTPSSHTHT